MSKVPFGVPANSQECSLMRERFHPHFRNTKRQRHCRWWIHPLILLALLNGSVSCFMTSEEFLCEAVEHLSTCCPDSGARSLVCGAAIENRSPSVAYSCRCDPEYQSYADLSVRASDCILDRSCESLRSRGACTE